MVGSSALSPSVAPGMPTLVRPVRIGCWPGDECRTASGAALLAVEVREHRAFLGDAVDVRRAIAHDAVVVATEIEPADVVGHDEENVRLAGLCHVSPPVQPRHTCPYPITFRRVGFSSVCFARELSNTSQAVRFTAGSRYDPSRIGLSAP